MLYHEGSNYLAPPPAVYKPPKTNSDVGLYENEPYLEVGSTVPPKEQSGSLPRSKDHNDNLGNRTSSGSAFSQHGLTYDQATQPNVPTAPVEAINSNYVGDDESDEYTYVNPLPVTDESENNAANKEKEEKVSEKVTEMIVWVSLNSTPFWGYMERHSHKDRAYGSRSL